MYKNLKIVMEIMNEFPDIFNDDDKEKAIYAHLGIEIAICLRNSYSIPPCYDTKPCYQCVYNDYCLSRKNRNKVNLRKEKKALDKFLTSVFFGDLNDKQTPIT